MGARLRCASETIRTIWARSVSAPTRSARITKPPVPFTVPPVTRLSGAFATGIGSPVTIDSSTALRPSSTTPSTGTRSPGRTRRRFPGRTSRERHVLLAAVLAQAARGLGREPQQRADGARRGAARAQLEHLAEEDERDDHRGGLEVHRRRAAVAHAVGQGARRQHGEDAPAECRRRAEGDQGEHVQVARHEGLPAAHEEGPAAPEHHRRRQQELNPERRRRIDPPRQGGRDHLAHGERKDGDGQDQAHPEPPGHVDQLGARPLVGGERLERLERHPALGARAGSDLADLRVHGTRVDPRVGMAAGGRCGGRRYQEFRRVSDEPLAAARVAEPVRGARVLGAAALRLPGRHVHAADRIDHGRGGGLRAFAVNVHIWCVSVVVAHRWRLCP